VTEETPASQPLQAVTFDYWDTLVEGAAQSERTKLRRAALGHLLAELGHPLPPDQVAALHREVSAELDRWWREEHRGYTTEDAVRLLLARRGITRPDECAHVTRAAVAIDEALVSHPPALLPGAATALRALASRFSLAIVSDTGIASGRAQDRILEMHGIRDLFKATIYSMDIGWAKPRPEMFNAALSALGVGATAALHVGDIERTDVRGALASGMRAIRVDIVRHTGSSDAELVATSLTEVADYLLRQP
jgi:putative hydrolase of the HAD superfamily